jgi:CRISPR-associated protein Cas1
LQDNVRILASYVSGNARTVLFNIPEINMRREDSVDIRNRILSMTSEERRKLGLARNTLFYMRKNIQKGKKIKIYGKVSAKMD